MSALKIIWNALPFVGVGVIILWFLGLAPPSSPRPPVQPTVTTNPPVLEALKHVNKQIFIEHYNAVDVTYSEVPDSWLKIFGLKQEFIVLIRGYVPAGFDLSQVSEKDVWVSSDGKRVQLILPPPVIFMENVAIDFENSRILSKNDTCPDLLCQENLTAYQNQVLPMGKEALTEFALSNGILQQAAEDGRDYYKQFLESFGFDDVQVVITGYAVE